MTLSVDRKGFVYQDGVKLPMKYIPESEIFEFVDKQPLRSKHRGTRMIHVHISEFLTLNEEGNSNLYCPKCNKIKLVKSIGLKRLCQCGFVWSVNPFEAKSINQPEPKKG